VKRFSFTSFCHDRLRLPQLGIAELFADRNQFSHELAKTTVFGDLRSGTIDRGSLGDDLGDGLSRAGMRQRVGGAVSQGVFLCTMAVGLTELAESRGERAGTEIADLSQIGFELLAFVVKSLEGNGHRVPSVWQQYALSGEDRKPHPHLVKLILQLWGHAPVGRRRIDFCIHVICIYI
jgi:hypothetical protein